MDLFEGFLLVCIAGISVAALVFGKQAARDLGRYAWDRHERTLPAVEPERDADVGDAGPDGRAS